MRFLYFIGGVSFCGLGYKVYTEGGWWSTRHGMYIDFNDIQKTMGIFMICIGVVCLFFSVRITSRMPEEYICLDCEHVEKLPHDKEHIYSCPNCGGKMELLFGFYDRHPEKRGGK